MLECRAKQLLQRCGCLPYYYPRLDILLQAAAVSRRQSNPDLVDDNDKYYNETSSTSTITSACDWKGIQCLARLPG